MPMSSAEKRKLKAEAQQLEAVLKIGKNGLSAAFLQSVDQALTQRGLVKLKFGDFKDQKKLMAPEIALKTGSELIARVGNVAVFFRPKP
ncbi:MAG: RNA-binding protein [Chthoniobacter sp.]|jgi:RNA-binding protein|nr:RNA-binding protein [Chthoniobacter sp.]